MAFDNIVSQEAEEYTVTISTELNGRTVTQTVEKFPMGSPDEDGGGENDPHEDGGESAAAQEQGLKNKVEAAKEVQVGNKKTNGKDESMKAKKTKK